ncbi:MAG: phage resistance protein [Acidobacteriota bacterium]|nr:phage resistance protein [Acidobacteriota bacterium]
MTYLKDLIHIPERVHGNDFVLQLKQGLDNEREVVDSYVVTPQLTDAFDRALGLIQKALDRNASMGAYLHGSFGSGKSHFMTILHLLLQNNPTARAKQELQGVLGGHDLWLQGKKLLLVPYYMIGAANLESRLLGGYADHIAAVEPDAPVPGVFQGKRIFQDAGGLRADLGDQTFFRKLNEGGGSLGKLKRGWNAQKFEAAQTAPAGDSSRTRLIGLLVERFFPSYRKLALTTDAQGEAQETFVDIEEGLSVISKHAAELGYHGVVLFLDELILWLVSRAADHAFYSREVPKVARLVETGGGDRPVPLISFIARQRDPQELVGDHLPGLEKQGFTDMFNYWEGRFDTITLEDRNLPAICEKRVVRVKTPADRDRLNDGVNQILKARNEVKKTLLTRDGTPEDLRKLYPFHPALLQALVAISAVLQRERTAIKLMFHMLSNRRESLKLGDLVAMGDLYDALAEGADPISAEMRKRWKQARRLYEGKLKPLLEASYGEEDVLRLRPAGDPNRRAFEADARLAKTLILAGLVPEVPCFEGLNAANLAALNHGQVNTPIPGGEAKVVLKKVQDWARGVGDIRIGDPPNPTITVQLTDVDTAAVMEKAQSADTLGERRKKIQELLYADLQLQRDSLFDGMDYRWRGTGRRVDLVFGNVREMAGDQFKARGANWKLIIDYPFDEPGYTPSDDRTRLEKYQNTNPDTNTLAWLPTFFSQQTSNDLGSLVILDFLLKSDSRFNDHTGHLSESDRVTARRLLENQRGRLRQSMKHILLNAYGLSSQDTEGLDTAHGLTDHIVSLNSGFTPRTPVGADLKAGMDKLLDQALSYQYPEHPHFEMDIKISALRKVKDQMFGALGQEGGRLVLDRQFKQVSAQIAVPLKLGEQRESTFVAGTWWRDHFLKAVNRREGPVTVGYLRGATDEPEPKGLPSEVIDLLILVFAEQTQRTFLDQGAPYIPEIGKLPDDLVLEEHRLPEPEVWDKALETAGYLCGLTFPPHRGASALADFSAKVTEWAKEHRAANMDLAPELRNRLAWLGLDPTQAMRFRTAEAAAALLQDLRAEGERLMEIMAAARLPGSPTAMGKAIKSAADVLPALQQTRWELIEACFGMTGDLAEDAARLRQQLCEAMSNDEFSQSLAAALKDIEGRVARLLVKSQAGQAPPAPVKGPPQKPASPAPGRKQREGLNLDQAQSLLRDLATRKVRDITIGWTEET